MDRATKTFLKSVFKQHRGLASQLARELEIAPCSITLWFQGKYDAPRLDLEVPRFLHEQGLPYKLPERKRREKVDPLEAVL